METKPVERRISRDYDYDRYRIQKQIIDHPSVAEVSSFKTRIR